MFCAVGLLSVLGQREIPLHENTEEKWGMEEESNKVPIAADDVEKSSEGQELTNSGAMEVHSLPFTAPVTPAATKADQEHIS